MSSLDPFTKLYRETTPCEHGLTNGHLVVADSPWGWCRGVLREEVVIDYEAAAGLLSTLDDIPSLAHPEEVLPFAIQVVDAALKSAGFTKTFTSEKEHQ